MLGKKYSAKLTKMLNQLEPNKVQPVISISRLKSLIPEERKIYMEALEKFAKQQRELFDKIVNKD